MIFSITTFTLFHTLISLVAIVAGLVVVGGLSRPTTSESFPSLFWFP